jgi:hypothetical protein
VFAKFSQRLSVSKLAAQKFDVERCNLKKLNEVEVKEKCQVRTSNKFAAMENLNHDDDVDINRT